MPRLVSGGVNIGVGWSGVVGGSGGVPMGRGDGYSGVRTLEEDEDDCNGGF